MNEGHSAFLALERIRLADRGEEARFLLRAAGRRGGERFHHAHAGAGGERRVPARDDAPVFRRLRDANCGIPFDELFTFGQTRVNPDDPFSMTILALRASRHANGVSKLHGDVSRALWKDVWAGVPEHEVPITSITNGVHTKTWMAPEFSALYTQVSRRLGRAPDRCAISGAA